MWIRKAGQCPPPIYITLIWVLEGGSTAFLGILFVKWLREQTLYTFIYFLRCLLQNLTLNSFFTQICCQHQHVMKKHQQGIKSMIMLTRYRLVAAEPSRSVLQNGDIKCNAKCQQWNRSKALLNDFLPFKIFSSAWRWLKFVSWCISCCTLNQNSLMNCKSVFGEQIPHPFCNTVWIIT